MVTGFKDITEGASNWRVWLLMGGNNLRQRYARSALGQWWIVLGTIITNAAFGLLWAQLWKQPIQTFLPYVAIGHICWALITGPLMDGIGALPATSYYYINQRAPFSTIFFAGYFRNLLIFAHNFVIVPVLWVIFKTPISLSSLLFIPALIIVSTITLNLSIIIGLVSCRYRDVGQIIASGLMVLYMVTPVMWISSRLNPIVNMVVNYNPFAQMLFLLRGPLVGSPPALYSWIFCIVFSIVTAMATVIAMTIADRKIVYWL